MSATFLAGQPLRAETMPWQRLWSASSTSASASIGTSESVVLSAPSSTYKANSAYVLEFRGLAKINTAAGVMSFAVRDTNAAGTIRKTLGGVWCGNTANNFEQHWFHVVANTSASTDITSRVLALTAAVSANTGVVNAGTAIPIVFNCYYVGSYSDYPDAVAL